MKLLLPTIEELQEYILKKHPIMDTKHYFHVYTIGREDYKHHVYSNGKGTIKIYTDKDTIQKIIIQSTAALSFEAYEELNVFVKRDIEQDRDWYEILCHNRDEVLFHNEGSFVLSNDKKKDNKPQYVIEYVTDKDRELYSVKDSTNNYWDRDMGMDFYMDNLNTLIYEMLDRILHGNLKYDISLTDDQIRNRLVTQNSMQEAIIEKLKLRVEWEEKPLSHPLRILLT